MVRLLRSFLLIIDELFKLEIGKQYTKYPNLNFRQQVNINEKSNKDTRGEFVPNV